MPDDSTPSPRGTTVIEPDEVDLGTDAAQTTAPPARRLSRVWIFATICLLCLIVAGGYLWHGASGGAQQHAVTAGTAADRDAILARPHLLFTEATGNTLTDYPLALAAQDQPDASHYHPGFSCQRVYYAAGEGLCLTLGHSSSPAQAFIFDANFQVLHTVQATGLPSRARISADGRYGAMTFFVVGDAYTTAGQFSTRASIIDMHTGAVAAHLEDFTITKNGQEFRATDFNFWGVTFEQDSNRFYATLGSGSKTYLIEGDVTTHTAHTLLENVECPSLSPDGQHIVFKKRLANGPPAIWRLYVLDLATMQEKPLAETRSVDDQAEWLDNSHVLYTPVTQSANTWEVPADGSGQPRLYAKGVVSPSVSR